MATEAFHHFPVVSNLLDGLRIRRAHDKGVVDHHGLSVRALNENRRCGRLCLGTVAGSKLDAAGAVGKNILRGIGAQ